MSASQATLSLLEQCIGRVPFYQNTARLRQDMQTLFYNCSTLRPNVGSFQSANGSITLFYLSGVVPISYNGANYNIPVTIYIDPPYPNQPPRVFVTPTADMAIKPNHKAVDANGRVYLPELSRWNPYSSNLVSIIGILSSVFSVEPPVHAVRSAAQHHQQQSHHHSNSHHSPAIAKASPVLQAHVVTPGMSRKDVLLNSLTVKVRAKLPARIKAEVDDLNRARQDENAVKENGARIKKAHENLLTLRSKLESEIHDLEAIDSQNREWIKKNTKSSETPDKPDSDLGALSYLEAESVVGQQVIDLMAEECAHEDLIDYLCALNRDGKISMSDLLKEIRLLTRKVFEIRSLKRRALVTLQSSQTSSVR
jgi:ESCRT-I complex subunit TSG101